MGLDMYVSKTKAKFTKEVDITDEIYPMGEDGHFDYENPLVEISELFYWRKHPDLHGWMEELYRAKGGTEKSFNGDQVVLTEEDLDELKITVLTGNLPRTSGFFFGESDRERDFEDLRFVEEGKKAIKEGYTIFYDSSW